jgi:aminoglycoside phosphotransferase (APT) family kinase protein
MAKAELEAVRAAILRAFPQLVRSRFKLLTGGWDSAAVDVDGTFIFKFPRDKDACEALRHEAAVLAIARPALSLAVPDLQLHEGPPLFSSHLKLKGRQIEADEYAKLTEAARQRLGEDLARFFVELHALDPARLKAAGARAIAQWHEPDTVRARALPLLTRKRARLARQIVEAYEKLPPDPNGIVFGYFDAHGWNMAFDRKKERLRGIYDFADSGFGALHQEFIASDMISADLTGRIVRAYEQQTDRLLDRRRIDILSGYHHLSELADFAKDRARTKDIRRNFKVWAREHADFSA